MTIEDNIFKRFVPDFKKLKNYGFTYKNNKYHLEKLFKNNSFKAVIEIRKDGTVTGKVYDLENNDEYLPLRVEKLNGKFAQAVRSAYVKTLKEIRDKCFNKKYFIYPQANRIACYIYKQYNDKPEFLWTKFPGYGVYRNPNNQKWYGIIMNIDRSKIEENVTGEIEVINLKLDKILIQDLLKKNGFYPAYHMNKKSWITIVLDETLKDIIITELIDISRRNTAIRQY